MRVSLLALLATLGLAVGASATVLPVASARAPSTGAATACGWGSYDFSSLTTSDLVGSDGSSTYSYYLRLCGSLESQPAAVCAKEMATASACQVQAVGGDSEGFDIGNWAGSASANWRYIDASQPGLGVAYTMLGAQSCWASGSPQPYTANVILECAATQGPLTVSVPQGSCVQNYTLPTPLACAGAAPPTPPSPALECGFDGRNLEKLMGDDLVGSDGSATYAYYLRVCGVLSSPAAATCTTLSPESSACQIQVQGGQGTYDIGNYDSASPPTWSLLDDGQEGVQYTLVGAEQCWAYPPVQPYVAHVQFVCASSQGPLEVTVPQGSCVQNYTVATPLACKSPPTPPTPTPSPSTECGFEGFDFSSLMGPDYSGSDGTSTYAYFLHVCGSLTSSAAAACTSLNAESSACQVQVQGGSNAFDIGNYNPASPPKWSYVNSGATAEGVQYTLQGAQNCWASGNPQYYEANVQFVCAAELGALSVTATQGSCIQNYTLPTPLACGGTPPQPAAVCQYEGYDFSSLMGADLEGSDGTPTYDYYLSVCGVLNSTAAAGCTSISASSSACQVQVQNARYAYDVGNYNVASPPAWSYIDAAAPQDGVQYSMIGARSCWANGVAMPYNTVVQFVCAQTQGLKVDLQPGGCKQTFVVSTPLACNKEGEERSALM